MRLIKKIQKKPRSTRVLIVWVSTFIVMIIVVLIWLFSFSKGFQSQSAEKEIEQSNLPSLFESIKKDFSTVKNNLKAVIYGQEE